MLTIDKTSTFYSAAKQLAYDYGVDVYHIESLLRVAIDNKQMKPANYSFNELLHIFSRDCQSCLEEHFSNIGLVDLAA